MAKMLKSFAFSSQLHSPILTSKSPLAEFHRNLTLSSIVCGKYHYVKKKRKLREEKRAKLQARLEKLDPEERPTGCLLCDTEINYKNVRLLSQFVSSHTGRIYSKEATGLCQLKQNEIKKAIRRARCLGYMPYTMKFLAFHEDPKLF
ncbi:28S ribosomal protein S18c, mitochondrial-like [Xenia sp. Carnegie-2017]|uniref:28S ribosomal protein S18c, mitochondrial-like n=1 Tax=Xenia sp. Carnegie-2017 TaxID=2897299 RepID=UPI001F04A23F|nr:28S ribosomal protein S18c, mitochondrial-like [Xenia sp. Carnegie-2017]XP_046850068.1 28S ribosomal protein S18c, mitochondrial-like [Xenia sp. Carnegie-2017]